METTEFSVIVLSNKVSQLSLYYYYFIVVKPDGGVWDQRSFSCRQTIASGFLNAWRRIWKRGNSQHVILDEEAFA